jgi:hypothetical protein
MKRFIETSVGACHKVEKPVQIVQAVQSLRSVQAVEAKKCWSEAIAIGSLPFVEKVKSELGVKALHREGEQLGGACALRERSDAYGGEFTRENDVLRQENTIFWDENAESTDTWRGPTL